MGKEQKTENPQETDFKSLYCSTKSRHFRSELGIWENLQEERKDEECVTKHFYNLSNPHQDSENLKQEIVQNFIKEFAENLAKEYSHITTYKGVLGGEPHLEGHRFAVTDVLAGLIVHNSFDGIIKAYNGTYSEKQLKQAVRYALYFIKNAFCLKNECE